MKKTKLFTSLAALALVLNLGACDVTSEEEATPEESEGTTETTDTKESTPSEPTLPVLGEVEEGDYFLGFNMDGVDYYFDGTVYNTNYAGVTSEIGLAVPVTVAAIDGGYSLSFDDDGETAYLNLTESGTYRNLKWGSEVYTWSYDTTYSVFVGLDSEGEYYFIGTYGTYKDLTLSAYGYLTGDIETTNAQYPAKLYAIPDDWEPYQEPEGAITIDAQYIIDNFERDNSDGYSDVYEMGSGSVSGQNDTRNDAEKNGFDVIGGVTMDFGNFDIEWFSGSTETKLWNGNQIRIYYASTGNGGGFYVTPHEGYQISSLSLTESNVSSSVGKLEDSALYTIEGETRTELTLGTDYTKSTDYTSLETLEGFSTTNTLEFRNTKTSSNTMYITGITILCEAAVD